MTVKVAKNRHGWERHEKLERDLTKMERHQVGIAYHGCCERVRPTCVQWGHLGGSSWQHFRQEHPVYSMTLDHGFYHRWRSSIDYIGSGTTGFLALHAAAGNMVVDAIVLAAVMVVPELGPGSLAMYAAGKNPRSSVAGCHGAVDMPKHVVEAHVAVLSALLVEGPVEEGQRAAASMGCESRSRSAWLCWRWFQPQSVPGVQLSPVWVGI